MVMYLCIAQMVSKILGQAKQMNLIMYIFVGKHKYNLVAAN